MRPWWDTVDTVAAQLCGGYFEKYPALLEPIIENWRRSNNLWVCRSSILLQLKKKENTDERLLFSTISHLCEEREFFIEKAIGWALREYSKTNPAAVLNYIEQNELRPLSRREGLKWIKEKDGSPPV
ncbi:DNA alkylation repair protein [Halobacillus massiliensis]|uniref:DNA alkylation repair protein n=1 Tax=Halobacillus massiliensis TaxID=1926286 RepID=UPI002481B8D0|nr:DNA alkylation repair protein [Halobacillus massiliensis]